MRPWHAVTRGEYKLWTNAGGTILFTAARRYPSENYRARSPSPQDVTWRDSWSQRDEEEDAMMTNWSTWKYSEIPIIWEPHILLCLGPKNWNTWLGYGQEKKTLERFFSRVFLHVDIQRTSLSARMIALIAFAGLLSSVSALVFFHMRSSSAWIVA